MDRERPGEPDLVPAEEARDRILTSPGGDENVNFQNLAGDLARNVVSQQGVRRFFLVGGQAAMSQEAQTILRRLLSVSDVAEMTGIQEWRLYELASTNQIPHVRIGRRILFQAHAVVRWLDEGGTAQKEG